MFGHGAWGAGAPALVGHSAFAGGYAGVGKVAFAATYANVPAWGFGHGSYAFAYAGAAGGPWKGFMGGMPYASYNFMYPPPTMPI